MSGSEQMSLKLNQGGEGSSNSQTREASSIRRHDYILIKNHPCKVIEVSTSRRMKGPGKCFFVGIDIFTGKKLETIVPSNSRITSPQVTTTNYQLLDITDDGSVILLTEDGSIYNNVKLPTDEYLLQQIMARFTVGKDVIVTVTSAMGKEQICAIKDTGPGSWI